MFGPFKGSRVLRSQRYMFIYSRCEKRYKRVINVLQIKGPIIWTFPISQECVNPYVYERIICPFKISVLKIIFFFKLVLSESSPRFLVRGNSREINGFPETRGFGIFSGLNYYTLNPGIIPRNKFTVARYKNNSPVLVPEPV